MRRGALNLGQPPHSFGTIIFLLRAPIPSLVLRPNSDDDQMFSLGGCNKQWWATITAERAVERVAWVSLVVVICLDRVLSMCYVEILYESESATIQHEVAFICNLYHPRSFGTNRSPWNRSLLLFGNFGSDIAPCWTARSSFGLWHRRRGKTQSELGWTCWLLK